MAEVAGIVLAALPLAITLVNRLKDSISVALYYFHEFVRLKKEYGLPQTIILVSIFPDARDVMDRTKTHLLLSSGDEPMAMKKSLAEDCNMLAVASAILAQVAITALSLENLNAVHWTAKACFIISLVTGSLSVFYACLVQQNISSLFGPEDVKDWLSKKIKGPPKIDSESAFYGLKSILMVSSLEDLNLDTVRNTEKAKMLRKQFLDLHRALQDDRWMSASLNAAIIIRVPAILLNWSVGAFLTGIGIYLGFIWRYSLDPPQSQGSSLAVLVVYSVVTFAGLVLFFAPLVLKTLEIGPVKRFRAQISDTKRALDLILSIPTVNQNQATQGTENEQARGNDDDNGDDNPLPPPEAPQNPSPQRDERLIAALEASIRAHQQSIEAIQGVLQNTGRGADET